MTVNPGPGHEPGYDEFYQSGHTAPELRGAVERSHALDPFDVAYNPDLASDAPPIDFQGVWSRGFAACFESSAKPAVRAVERAGWGSPDAEPMVDIRDFLMGPAMLPRAPDLTYLLLDAREPWDAEAMEQEEQRWRQLLARLPEVTVTIEGTFEHTWLDDPRPDLVHPFID